MIYTHYDKLKVKLEVGQIAVCIRHCRLELVLIKKINRINISVQELYSKYSATEDAVNLTFYPINKYQSYTFSKPPEELLIQPQLQWPKKT